MYRLLALAIPLFATSARADTAPRAASSPQAQRVTCSITAARRFGVPAHILLAVAELEGGRPGQRVRNRNGSFDVGPMQFNTRYLEHLEQLHGITAADVAAAGCYPYELAAWRLRKHLERDAGDVWTRAANYHSRSPAQNSKYRRKLIAKAAAWSRRISDREQADELPVSRPRDNRASRKSTRQRTSGRKSANADELRPDIDDDRADIELLVTLLDDQEDLDGLLARPSHSIDPAPAGSLLKAVQLPAHDGYVVRDPSRAWGTADTINRLTSAFDEIIRTDPFAPRVRVHDLSLPNGGPMRGHKSHQSGRDVDLTYYRLTCDRECAGHTVPPGDLDAHRQWRLLHHWLDRGQAELIFVDYALQRPLYEQAKAAGASTRKLAHWFQYPRGPAFPGGIIRHVPNHANHVHVRFRCGAQERECNGIPTRRVREHPEQPVSPLLELLEDESEHEAWLE